MINFPKLLVDQKGDRVSTMQNANGEFEPYVSFDEWTKSRDNVVLGTNSGSELLAFQNWRRIKEAFAPEFVERAIKETEIALGRRLERCLDPCAGSGTTPLTCQFLGVQPVAIEINPYLADLIQAKLTIIDEEVMIRRCEEVMSTSNLVDPKIFYADAPTTFVEPGVGGRYLFQHDIAERLASLVNAINTVPEVSIRRLLKVLLGSASLEVCNAIVSGKGRRYRQNWKDHQWSVLDLDNAFVRYVEAAVSDITKFARRKTLSYDLRRGDARREVENIPMIDLAVFSPPYPNSFDYTDVYNIELWGLGYLRNNSDNTALRNATFRSHVQTKHDYSVQTSVPIINNSIAEIRATNNLWNKDIPDMICAYFADLEKLLQDVRAKITNGGRVYMIVGDSKYAGITVPVADAIIEIGSRIGYAVISTEPIRSMRTSPQQGGRLELSETLLSFTTT